MREYSLHVSTSERFNIYRIPASWCPKVRFSLRIRVDQSRCLLLLIERCFDIIKAYMENCLSIFHELTNCTIIGQMGKPNGM